MSVTMARTLHASLLVMLLFSPVQAGVEGRYQPPTWEPVGDTVVVEGTVFSRTLVATDPDGPAPQLTAGPLPANAAFLDSGNGHGQLTFAPSYVQAGLYVLTFFASDGLLSDTLSFVVAVSEAGDQAPVIDPVDPLTVDEGSTARLRVVAHDPESTNVSLRVSGLPANAQFVDSGGGVGGLVFTPDFTQAGTFIVVLLATDQGVPPLSQIGFLSLTVNDVNRPPILDSIGPKLAVMEQAAEFDVSARDTTAGAGSALLLTTSDLPAGAGFVDSGQGRGRFSWTPAPEQVGTHYVTFTVTDNGAPVLHDEETVQITVLSANRAPVLAAIGPRFVTEGQTLQFSISATDPDGTIPALQIIHHPPSASLADSGNGAAVFSYTPAYMEAGLRSVEFRATDGITIDKEIVLIQVLDGGNQPPTAAVSGPPWFFERDTLVAIVSSDDPDGTPNLISVASPLPANSTFQDQGDGTATFQFVPWFTQAGPYILTFAVSDGTFVDSVTYGFTIFDVGNQAPFLHAVDDERLAIPDMSFREERRDSLLVAASDYDSTVARLSAAGLPSGATFDDLGGHVGRLLWRPDFSQAGVFQVTIFARDSGDSTLYDSQLVSLTVDQYFPAPVWNPTIEEDHVLAEGSTLELVLDAIPIDTVPRFRMGYHSAHSTLMDHLDGTCTFRFQPDYYQAGLDSVVLFAYHPLDTMVQTRLALRFMVINTPQPPAWRPRGDTSVVENTQLQLQATADDPDGITPALSAENLPAGAIFQTYLQGGGSVTGQLSWKPGYHQQGQYPIRLLVADDLGVDTLVVTVTVVDGGNQAPLFTLAPTDATILVPAVLSVWVKAADPDSTTPTLHVEHLPRNTAFVDSGNGSGWLLFAPDSSQADSTYGVDYFASDGVVQQQISVTYLVYDFMRGDVNRDSRITSSDVIYLVNYVFKSGPPPVPPPTGDADKSGTINSADVIYLVNHIFKGGPPPAP